MELTLPTILCCICGTGIEPNAANMCMNCLRDNIDVTQDINTKVTIHSCHNCGRFLGPPWQQLELESKELMVMCLRKINGLNKVKLIDAVWIWTEPHSMRLKVKLTVQKEVSQGAVVQQACVVEFTIRNQQCKHCEASFATGDWHAIVQLRQRVAHKRTFFYLEQLILKHEAHTECIKIVTFRDGMDFYYKDKNQAVRFIAFLNTHIPCKQNYSRKLVSADHTNNTADFKHNFLLEIPVVCKDDLVLLPKDLASKQSNISRLVLVKRIHSGIHLIDPLTGERTEVNGEKYWRYSFTALLTPKSLVKFIVLAVEPVLLEHKPSARMKRVRGGGRKKSAGDDEEGDEDNRSVVAVRAYAKLADVTVARERDMGVCDTQFIVRTHLGCVLHVGDSVYGYDLVNTNVNAMSGNMKGGEGGWGEAEGGVGEGGYALPDVILVRKAYDTKDRIYTLKNLDSVVRVEKGDGNGGDVDGEGEAAAGKGGKGRGKSKAKAKGAAGSRGEGYDADYEDFMQQIDADKEMRAHINLYRKSGVQGKAGAKKAKGEHGGSMEVEHDSEPEDDDEDEERVRLEELLDEMTLKMAGGLGADVEEGQEEGNVEGNKYGALEEDDEDEDL
eukprot:gene24626-29753_t